MYRTGNSWILRCLRFCEFWWFLNWLGFPIKIVWSSICFTTSRSSNDVLLLTKETLRKPLILLMRKGSVEITRFSAWYFEDFHYFLANQAKSIIQNNRNFLFFKTREKKSCSRRRTKFALYNVWTLILYSVFVLGNNVWFCVKNATYTSLACQTWTKLTIWQLTSEELFEYHTHNQSKTNHMLSWH